MVTMKDVARLAGVSASTVSIVVNGNAATRSIPQATIDKVQFAINQLGYQPNRSARQLRSAAQSTKEIAFYWPLEQPASVLAGLLMHMQQILRAKKLNWRLVIQTYQNDYLLQALGDLTDGLYDGAIIGATSDQDEAALQQYSCSVPIVMINRESPRFSSVNVDPKAVAQVAITLFLSTGVHEFSIISTNLYPASSQRIAAITDLADTNHIHVKQHYQVANTHAAGVTIAKQIAATNNREPLLIESDVVALGMTYYFNRQHIQIPGDLKLISLGVMDDTSTLYTTPSISTIEMPAAAISESVIAVMAQLLKKPLTTLHDTIEPQLKLRDSFPIAAPPKK